VDKNNKCQALAKKINTIHHKLLIQVYLNDKKLYTYRIERVEASFLKEFWAKANT